MEKPNLEKLFWKLFMAGGWLPLTVFVVNLFLKYVVDIYDYWRRADILIHIVGGFAIAYFISGSYQLLPHEKAQRSRVVLLELLLIVSLTITMAVFWEFGEFTMDLILNTNVQESLANTMLDLSMGILGMVVVLFVRARRLKVGISEVKEVFADMSG